MKNLQRALHDLKKFLGKGKYYSLFLFAVFVSLVSVAEPLFFSRVLLVVEEFIKSGVLDIDRLTGQVIVWAIFIIFSIILQYTYRYYFADKSILRFYAYVLKEKVDTALQISYGSYLGKKQGETYKRLERGRFFFINFFFFFFLDFMKNFSGILIIAIFMLLINVKMTLITFSLFPIAIFIGLFFNKKTIDLQKKNNDEEDIVFGKLSDGLTNFGLFKILGLEKRMSQSFATSMDTIMQNQFSISKRWSIASIYIGVLIMILRLIVLVTGVYFMTKGELNLAELFLFFSYVGWIYFPLGAMFSQLRGIQEWDVGLGKYYEEFEDTIELEEQKGGKTLKNVSGHIVFDNVSFGYSPDNLILRDIDLDIPAGQKIALVGDTGAGKSTIVNLLLRFWDTSSGAILLDGINVNDIKKSSLRSHIGVVSQDNSLFNLSIEENLKFANPKATKSDIEKALKQAEATFVFDLPQGIKTVIGERGLKLSGGEKQRISIARLFLKNPEILLLDEATSALDNKTEKLIQKSLDTLMRGKTSIIIAHRLSTIQHADVIYVLENGRVVESGNYEELMAKQKKFFQLANPEKLMLG